MTPPKRSDYGFFFSLTPRWGDLDALGHVNNVKFFTYDESARLEYFNDFIEGAPKFILAHIEADFLAQLTLPATLEIGFRVARFGGKSLCTEAAMFRGEEVIAVTRSVLVWFDYAANQTLPVPETVKKRIREREVVAPEE